MTKPHQHHKMTESHQQSIVRIYSNNGTVIGAGFLVSKKRILTCAHVVAAALGVDQDTKKKPDGQFSLDFPLLQVKHKFTARVVFWQPYNPGEPVEDIAGLELLEDDLPEMAQPAQLISSDDFWKHPFQVFGFPDVQSDGVWVHGELLNQQGKGWVQLQCTQETGYRLEHGFSGAPIWDEKLEGVVGMAVSAENNRPEAKAAFMIPTNVLRKAWEELDEPTMRRQPPVNSQSTSHKVFIAHCNEQPDLSLAEKFYQAIEGAGHKAFMAKLNIQPGEKWSSRIARELKQCDYFLLLLSEKSANSVKVKDEVKQVYQLHQESGEHNPTIVTIRVKFSRKRDASLDDVELMMFLNQFQDLQWHNEHDTETIRQTILKLLNHKEGLPTESSSIKQPVPRHRPTKPNLRRIIAVASMIMIGIGIFGWKLFSSNTVSDPLPKTIGTTYELGSELLSQGERTFFAGNPNAYKNKAIEAFKNKKFESAEKNFEAAILVSKNDPELLIYYNNAKAWGKSNPLTLAVVVPIGDQYQIAQTILRGVAHAQDDFNRDGGLHGRLLNIVIANDQDDPSQAKKVARELIKISNVIGVIGHMTSSASAAALPEYEKADLAMISPTSTSTSLKNKVFFRTVPSDKSTAKKLVDYATKHNIKQPIVVYQKDDYGNSLYEEFKNLFKEEVVQSFNLNPKSVEPAEVKRILDDISPIILEDRADSAIFFTNPELTHVVVEIAKGVQKIAPNQQRKLKLLGGDGLYTPQSLKAEIEGLILAVPWFNKEQNRKPKKFAEKAKEKWETTQINWVTAASYDATQAFIESFRSGIENPNREAVLTNLRSVRLSLDETSGNELYFSGSEREQEPVLVQVIGGSSCKDVGQYCFDLVK